MSTRFYWNVNQAPAVSPSFGAGAPDFRWDSSTSATRCQLLTSKSSGDTPTTQGPRAITNNTSLVFLQGVSEPLPTGTVFTTSTLVKAYCQGSESATDDNAFPCLAISVYSEDGATLRQTLRPSTSTNGVEFATTVRNKRFANSDALILGYTTVAGDRLVIELGGAIQAGVSPSASLRYGSDGTDLPEDETETGSTFVPWVEFTNLTIFPTSAGFSGAALMDAPLATLQATVDGLPVDLLDWQASAKTNFGDETLTAKVPSWVTWAQQGSEVTIWRSIGDALWTGTIDVDPFLADDVLSVRASGPAAMLEDLDQPLMYRVDGFGAWADKEEDPFAGTNNDKWELTLRPGIAKWRQGTADAFSTNDQAGFIVWAERCPITRYSFTARTGASYGAFDLQTQRKTGPTGTNTDLNTHALSIGSPTNYAANISPDVAEDALILRIKANTNASAGTRRVVDAYNMRVYGRTNDDAFSASDAVTDVAGVGGFATTNIQPNALAILPLHWTEDLPGMLTYISELTDWRWLLGHSGMTFGPYERTWDAFSETDADMRSLQPERRFNLIRVPWRTVGGRRRFSSAAPVDDPFPGQTFAFTMDELADPQPDGTLAAAVAAQRAEFEASVRLSGQVELSRVSYLGVVHSPYDVAPGDLLRFPDLALPAQRIAAVTYGPTSVSVTLTSVASDVVRVLKGPSKSNRRGKPPGLPTRIPA